MGLFTDHYQATFKDHIIEIEARVTSILGTAQYDLIIDQKRDDRIEGMFGKFTLRGQINETEEGKVEVKVNQCIGTKYQLFVGGESVPIQRA